MAVNYEYYKVFYYVAKYHSLTRAAAALFSSQPNVSRVMSQLEHDLGCQLLIRTNKGVSLTGEGERLYPHVEAAFEQLQLGEEELAQSVELCSGTVLVGASETALHLYLLERLRVFRKKYPGVRLKIFNYSTPQAMAALKTGQIDFAAVTTPAEFSPPFRSEKLMPFRDILVGGPGFEALACGRQALRELQGQPLICLGKNTGTYEFYNRFYLDNGLVFEPDIEVATADLILPMVRHGLGLGFLPRTLAQRELEEGLVFEIPLEEKIPQRCVCMVWDGKRGFSIAAKELKKLLAEQGETG